MAQVAGITVERTLRGTPMYLRKNLNFVAIEENEKKDNLPCGYITLEDFRKQGLQMINELCDKYDIDKETCTE